MKRILLLCLALSLGAQDYSVYRLTTQEGMDLHQSYDSYLKAQKVADSAYAKYDALRYKAAQRVNSTTVWCAHPNKSFTFMVQGPGCGEQ